MTRLTAMHVDHHHDEFYHDCPNRGWLRLERLFVFHNDDNDDHHNHRNHDQAECDMWGSLMIMTIMMLIVMTSVIQADSNKRGSSPAKSSKGDHCEDCGWQGVQVRLSSFPNNQYDDHNYYYHHWYHRHCLFRFEGINHTFTKKLYEWESRFVVYLYSFFVFSGIWFVFGLYLITQLNICIWSR